MASTNATLPVETAVIWSDDENAPDAVVAARAAAAAQRAEARRRAAATPEAAWRLQQDHADDLASAFKELETLVHDADRKRRARRPRTRRRRAATMRPRPTRPRRRPPTPALCRCGPRGDADAPAAEAKQDDDDDDDGRAEYCAGVYVLRPASPKARLLALFLLLLLGGALARVGRALALPRRRLLRVTRPSRGPRRAAPSSPTVDEPRRPPSSSPSWSHRGKTLLFVRFPQGCTRKGRGSMLSPYEAPSRSKAVESTSRSLNNTYATPTHHDAPCRATTLTFSTAEWPPDSCKCAANNSPQPFLRRVEGAVADERRPQVVLRAAVAARFIDPQMERLLRRLHAVFYRGRYFPDGAVRFQSVGGAFYVLEHDVRVRGPLRVAEQSFSCTNRLD